MPRAKRLKYQGEWIERRDAEGNVIVSGPSESFPGIPARDLTDEDIAALDDDQYRDATASGLYLDPDAKKGSAKSAKKAEQASAEEVSAQQAENVAAADEDATDGGDADGSRPES